MSEREYFVYEHMATSNIFVVTARNKAEAIQKAKNGDYDFVHGGDITPTGAWSATRANFGQEPTR